MRREVARAECARELRTTLDRHGISQDALSAFVGTSDTRVRKWCDPESPETPGVADLVLFPREVVVDLLSWALKGHGLHVFDHGGELAGGAVEDHLAHLHSIIIECTDVQREYSLALSTHGGRITKDERERLRKELREARAAFSKLEHTLDLDEQAESALASGNGGVA